MKISTTVRYGVRALYELAVHYHKKPMQVAEIALNQGLTPRYLEQIFYKLKKSGIIDAYRGRNGGYYLIRDPEKITIGDIIKSLDGPIELVRCRNPKYPDKKCIRANSCPTKFLWEEIGEKLSQYFDEITLNDLCRKFHEKQ